MKRVMDVVSRFLRDKSGATAVEYGLIAAAISVAILATLSSIGGHLLANFTAIDNVLK